MSRPLALLYCGPLAGHASVCAFPGLNLGQGTSSPPFRGLAGEHERVAGAVILAISEDLLEDSDEQVTSAPRTTASPPGKT